MRSLHCLKNYIQYKADRPREKWSGISARIRRSVAIEKARVFDGLDEWICEIYKWNNRLSVCTGIPHHVDHVLPLACGGADHAFNMQPIPARLNSMKGKKTNALIGFPYRSDGLSPRAIITMRQEK